MDVGLAMPSVPELLLDKDHSAQLTWTDPSLPLLEVTAQFLPMSLTCIMCKLLAVKDPSPKARPGTM